MALQGTLDTFALADLVRLLATTEKTGELRIEGADVAGRLWFAEGAMVGGEPTNKGEIAEALFNLLRLEEGDFEFIADKLPNKASKPQRALEVLGEAEEQIEAWKPVVAMVPNGRVSLKLVSDLSEDREVSRKLWTGVVAVGHGSTAADLASDLDLSEVEAGFFIKALVDAGLVEIGPEVEPEPHPLDVSDSDAVAEEPAFEADDQAEDVWSEQSSEIPDALEVQPFDEEPARPRLAAVADLDELEAEPPLTQILDPGPVSEPTLEQTPITAAVTDELWADVVSDDDSIADWQPLPVDAGPLERGEVSREVSLDSTEVSDGHSYLDSFPTPRKTEMPEELPVGRTLSEHLEDAQSRNTSREDSVDSWLPGGAIEGDPVEKTSKAAEADEQLLRRIISNGKQ